MKEKIEAFGISFDEKGLVPAIVQDYYTKEVLTLAYMNKESLAITLEEGYTCFWSRSRQELFIRYRPYFNDNRKRRFILGKICRKSVKQ